MTDEDAMLLRDLAAFFAMQARLDDREKVIEKLIASLTNLAEASAPTHGFRTPKK